MWQSTNIDSKKEDCREANVDVNNLKYKIINFANDLWRKKCTPTGLLHLERLVIFVCSQQKGHLLPFEPYH